jgi:signal transduction histidine kinase
MERNNEIVTFSDVLAPAVHDMKNSLSMLLDTLNDVVTELREQENSSYKRLSQIQYEAKRVNHNLIQLLTIYKVGKGMHSLSVSYHSVYEMLEEIMLVNQELLALKGIEIGISCPDGLFGFFDREMISGVLNNILNNAFRYANSKILLRGAPDDGFLVLSVEDDGMGYPESMLAKVEKPVDKVSFTSGSTGLGLYFSSLVAELHKNNGKTGMIVVENGGEYGGGCFSIRIP